MTGKQERGFLPIILVATPSRLELPAGRKLISAAPSTPPMDAGTVGQRARGAGPARRMLACKSRPDRSGPRSRPETAFVMSLTRNRYRQESHSTLLAVDVDVAEGRHRWTLRGMSPAGDSCRFWAITGRPQSTLCGPPPIALPSALKTARNRNIGERFAVRIPPALATWRDEVCGAITRPPGDGMH